MQRDVQYALRTGNESEKKWKLKLTLTILKLLNGDAVYILPQATDPCKCLELLIVLYVFINSGLQKL